MILLIDIFKEDWASTGTKIEVKDINMVKLEHLQFTKETS